MKILITGGAGFIGSHIQDACIESGHIVAILDNFRSGKKENIHPKSTLFEVDIKDSQEVLKAFEKFRPEAVFHLAAQNEVPYSMEHPLEDLQANIVGTFNLLEAAKITGVKKIIYSNTGGAYYGEVPETDLPITEDHPVKFPTSFYGVSKATAEQYLKLYAQVFGISYVSLRYSNVYGPRQAGNKEAGIVAIFTTKMLDGVIPTINGDGTHTRDYVFVSDVVSANMLALNYPHNDYFNISTSTEISNNKVYETLSQLLQITTPVNHGPERPGDVKRNSLSNTKATQLLNWSPKYDFSTGVAETVKFYKK